MGLDWQSSADSVPSTFISDDDALLFRGRPPVTGAWRDGDPIGERQFQFLDNLHTENGEVLARYRISYQSWGELSPARDNAVLILHALTGDSHVTGAASPGHMSSGWWSEVVGPGLAIDTDKYYVIAPNILGGCQGSTGPASVSSDGREWGSRFPLLTIRDQSNAVLELLDALQINELAAVVGGSMGGMHALELAILAPERVKRLAVLASTAATSADQIAANTLQAETIRIDPAFAGGDYYDESEGPHRGLALARRMALLSYRSPDELNQRFRRSWQSEVNPIADGGRFAVESYLDFHGNRFTRRFDANSYLLLLHAMNSHDVGRERGGIEDALATITAQTLVLGIDSDRLFPLAEQDRISRSIPNSLTGDRAGVITSEFGHDGFLIESESVSSGLKQLLDRSVS